MKHSEMKINRREVIGKLGAVSGLGLLSAHASAGFPGEGSVVTVDKRIKLFDTLVNAQKSDDIQEGDFILTAGYYHAGDGGAAGYLIAGESPEPEVNPGDRVPFSGDHIGVLTGVVEVNYKIFGARGDSVNDDGIQIKAAHDYANRHKLPVVNRNGEYWIKRTRNIAIKTSVQWGATVFHINEAFNTKEPVFVVSGYEEGEGVFLDASEKRKVIGALKPGCQQIPELKAYKNSLVYIEDSNDRIGFRAGY